MVGKLELYIGPMFASKSTELIRIANRYKSIGKKILAINHIYNNRYSSHNITTHDKNVLNNCYVLENLIDIFDIKEYNDADIIIIEELQFYNDAYFVICNILDNSNKIIICAGLDGDYKRNPFGDVVKLIPHAEKVKKLSALCKYCGDKASFTKLKEREDNMRNSILVGAEQEYESVCRKHYLSK